MARCMSNCEQAISDPWLLFSTTVDEIMGCHDISECYLGVRVDVEVEAGYGVLLQSES